jgi:sulfur-oxidizing protein SoxZ
MSDPIRIRSRQRAGLTEVLLLIPHPMETGMRKDDSGAFVAARYITSVKVAVEGRTVLEARMSRAVSHDPLLTFRFRGGASGDRIDVTWTDSQGDHRSDELRLAFG